MKMYLLIILSNFIIYSKAYRNNLFTMVSNTDLDDTHCRVQVTKQLGTSYTERIPMKLTYEPVASTTAIKPDPFMKFQKTIGRLLFGHVVDSEYDPNISQLSGKKDGDVLALYPSGDVLRGELFNNRSAVHLPFNEFMHRGHIFLRVTRDYMQTAVNAFAIFLEGDLNDILRLPIDYVLRSSRTIAMMKLAREKLAATWTIVKDGRHPVDVTYETLEMYRPLFKHVNGREIARLNMSDSRILNYIGTHPDLSRHQVGVVANTYINLNPNWRESKYLNLMNNLICGIPMVMMRSVTENTFLQLAPQIFYHTRACHSLQRRFFLARMTRTQVLGKSYSWNARDVSRLGLLLTELDGSDLGAINPEAMSGISAKVMAELSPKALLHITEMQSKYLKQKPLNILARKLKEYKDDMAIINQASPKRILFSLLPMFIVAIKLFK